MTGLLSVMTPLALPAYNLQEISVRTSLVGSLPGCQFPNLSGVCVSRLLQKINTELTQWTFSGGRRLWPEDKS